MMDNSREQNRQIGLYALAFGFALTIRLIRLGELPLGDVEARWALQAVDFVKGLRPAMGPQPAYVVLTALSFFILQTSNFAARLVPALFGAALSLVPFQFRDRLGHKPAVLLAFFLALDPGLLALSRMAGSSIIALTALLFAWGAWRNRSWPAAGFWAGLALLSGPQTWPGFLGIIVGRGLLHGLFSTRSQEDAEDASEPVKIISPNKKDWLSLAGYAIVTYLILGSFFMLASGGLSAGLASIPAYFGGWFSPSGVPASRLLISLIFYELLPLLLAIASLVRGILKRDELRIGLGLWLAAVFVLVLANPSRQVTDLGWVLIPLLTLAAVEVSGYLVPIQDGTWETIGMAAFTTSLLIFAALNYSSIALVPTDQVAGQLRWGILFGSLGLLGVSIIMVAFGWSILTAVQGSLWGGLAVMLVYSLSMSVASGGLRSTHSLELWPPGAYIDQEKTLVSQMDDISRWNKGVNSDLDVAIAGVDSPALLWALRNWPVTVLPEANLAGSTPAVVISTQDLSSSNIQSIYRGQDFTWRMLPAWEQGLPSDWLRWSILHEFPVTGEKLILWVRNDMFIDSQNSQ